MLVDTNIVSYFFRGDSRAQAYERHLKGQTRHIAFVTLGELYLWLFLRPFTELKRQRLLEFIGTHVLLPYDDQLAWTWAELSAKLRESGKTISPEDMWIAATALRHGLPIVTHNRRHFEGISGLTLISED